MDILFRNSVLRRIGAVGGTALTVVPVRSCYFAVTKSPEGPRDDRSKRLHGSGTVYASALPSEENVTRKERLDRAETARRKRTQRRIRPLGRALRSGLMAVLL